MKKSPIGVGVIGAGINGAWGGIAHLPALKGLPEFRVAAISTSRQSSADTSAQHYGVPHAFADPYELAAHPDVDLVTISVRVPEHDKLIRTALKAGKHVYSEFPLGRTTEESAKLLQAAEEKGVRHFIGLQARANPAVQYVKDLIADGYVGDVLAAHSNYSLPTYSTRSKQIDLSHAYLLDDTSGANQLTIAAGHLLDGITYLLGSFSEVSAILKTQTKHVPVEETGEIITATAPDHVVVNGTLANGAVMSSQIRNTYSGHFSLEINGTKGDLILNSKENFMFQIDTLSVQGSQGNSNGMVELPIPSKYSLQPAELQGSPAFNVAGVYQQIYKDLHNDTHFAPDFHSAFAVHELMDQIRKASATGVKQILMPA